MNIQRKSLIVVVVALMLSLVIPFVSNPQLTTVIASATRDTGIANPAPQTEQIKAVDYLKPESPSGEKFEEEKDYDKTEIIAEDVSKRTATSKTFVQADGSYLFQDYGTAIHYIEDGEFREIDNTIKWYKNSANDFTVNFSPGNPNFLVQVSNEQGSISMTPAFQDTAAKISDIHVYNGENELVSKREVDNPPATRSKPQYESNLLGNLDGLNIKNPDLKSQVGSTFANNNSSIYYFDLYDGIDIQYIIEGKKLKENIIINAPQDDYSFKFEMNLGDFFAIQTESGEILIKTPDDELMYTIPQGYMYDAAQNYSSEIKYELSYEGESCFLTVVADAGFFENCAFPVVVDPPLDYTGNLTQFGKHRRTKADYSGGFGTNYHGGILGIGSYYEDAYANLSEYPINKLVEQNVVRSATLKANTSTSGRTFYFYLRAALYPWDLYNAPYIYSFTPIYPTSTSWQIDVTHYLNNYLNQGILTIASTTTGNNSITNFSSTTLTIHYEQNRSDSELSQDLGESGTGIVNLYSGELNYSYEDVVINDAGFLPISISHIYSNTLENVYSHGNKWKLNIQQSIQCSGGSFSYMDALGNKHYFSNDTISGKKIVENKPLGLLLYKNDNNYTNVSGITRLIDKQGNSLVFENGNLIELHQFPSRYESGYRVTSLMLTITYNSNSKISSISNGCTTLNLYYMYSKQYLTGIASNATIFTQYVYTLDNFTEAIKYIGASFLTTNFEYEYAYLVSPLKKVYNNKGEQIQYNYSLSKVQSVTTSNTNVLNSSKTVNINYYVNAGPYAPILNSTKIEKTTILKIDEKYYRHVSFFGPEVISDYAYEKSGDGIIPIAAFANGFDFDDFTDTYANSRDLPAPAFNPSQSYSGTVNLGNVSLPAQSVNTFDLGAHGYAISAWVRCSTINGTLKMSVTPNSNGPEKIYEFNNATTEWQFATIILQFKDIKWSSSVNISFKGTGTTYNISMLRIFKLPQGPIADNLSLFFAPDYNYSTLTFPKLIREYKYNPLDDTIKMFQYTYLANSGTNQEYPGLISSVSEYSGPAFPDKPSYLTVASLQRKVTYTYTNQMLTGKKVEGSSSSKYFLESYNYTNGQMTSYTDADGVVTNYSYNNGVVTSTVVGTGINSGNSPNVSTTDTYYEGTNLLASTTTGSITTSFGYNQNRDLSTITHNGFNTTFAYDISSGALQNISVPGKTLTTYSYSQSQDSILYGNGQSVGYLYDGDDRLEYVTNSDNSYTYFQELAHDHNIIHNAGSGAPLYQYRDNYSNTLDIYNIYYGSNTVDVHSIPGADGNRTTNYYFNTVLYDSYKPSYNAKGQLTTLQNANGRKLMYYYDSSQRMNLKNTYLSNANIHFRNEYTYAMKGGAQTNLPSTQKFGTYTGYGEPTVKSSYAYSYYDNGNLQSMSSTGTQVRSSSYTYDQYNRLTSETNGSGTTNYTYDSGGNVQSRTGATVSSFTYDPTYKDLLKSLTLAYTTYTIEYDGAGNPTNWKWPGLVFDWQNGRQLASIGGSGYIGYKYDYAGLRTKKSILGTDTDYFWEGDKLLGEITGGLLTWYYYDESGVCGMNYYGVDYYFEKNILGDVVAIWQANGTLVGTYAYDAWGYPISMKDAAGNELSQYSGHLMTANKFRYRSYYFDQETYFYYLQSRYYDPEVGRFLNADEPTNLFYTADVVGGANLYAYCGNNPVAYTDPDGEFFLTALIIGAIVGAAVAAATYTATYVVTGLVTGESWDWKQFGIAVGFGALGGALSGGFGSLSKAGGIFANAFGRTTNLTVQIAGQATMNAGLYTAQAYASGCKPHAMGYFFALAAGTLAGSTFNRTALSAAFFTGTVDTMKLAYNTTRMFQGKNPIQISDNCPAPNFSKTGISYRSPFNYLF